MAHRLAAPSIVFVLRRTSNTGLRGLSLPQHASFVRKQFLDVVGGLSHWKKRVRYLRTTN
eukprot:14367380-Alexandrium_andersonii.AAC.1